jgi:hypothetical protein
MAKQRQSRRASNSNGPVAQTMCDTGNNHTQAERETFNNGLIGKAVIFLMPSVVDLLIDTRPAECTDPPVKIP